MVGCLSYRFRRVAEPLHIFPLSHPSPVQTPPLNRIDEEGRPGRNLDEGGGLEGIVGGKDAESRRISRYNEELEGREVRGV